MTPHPKNSDDVIVLENFVDKAVLDIDPPGIRPNQIAHELFARWRILKRVFCQNCKKFLRFDLQASSSKLLSILHRQLGIDHCPGHQSSSFALLPRGSAIPSFIDSRMPGTDSR